MLRPVATCLATLGLALASPRAQVVLGPPITTPTPPAEFELRTADFDDDGHLDILFRAFTLPALRFGDGRGHFSASVVIEPHIVADDLDAGDVDGDGRPDVVAIDGSPAGTVIHVLLSLGGTEFAAAPPLPVSEAGVFGAFLRLRDADGDADLDLVAQAGSETFLAVNDGAGHFELHPVPINVHLGLPEMADFDSDGLADVAAGFGTLFDLLAGKAFTQVLLGQPDGSLVPVAPWPQQMLLVVADLDADGQLDVLTDAYVTGEAVVAHLGQAGGGFADGPVSPVPFGGSRCLGDFDSDGVLDLVAGFEVHLGDGAGGFATEKAVAFYPGFISEFLVADIVADGRADLLFRSGTGSTDGSVVTLSNLTYPAGGPLLDLGYAKSGWLGWPILYVSGELQPGAATSFQVWLGTPNAVTVLIAGLSEGLMPFHGGTLVPTPDVVLGPLVTDSQGSLLVQVHWPVLASGSSFIVQGWMVAPGSPGQYAATTGVQITVP